MVADAQKSGLTFEAALQRLLTSGAHVITANCLTFRDWVKRDASPYLQRYFILHDTVVGSTQCFFHSIQCARGFL